MTPEEEAAFEKEAHESYQQYLIEEIEKKEQFLDYANHGIKFKKGKPSGAKSKKILYIEELVKKNPNLKAKELFKLADPEIIKQMALGTFQNHISKIKSKQK